MNLDDLKKIGENNAFKEAIKSEENVEEFRFLAQGEYNQNFVFATPGTGKKLVLRINYGSQMNLENQIEYEFEALKCLEKSNRTPRALYVNSSCSIIPRGFLVMDFLDGNHLRYEEDHIEEAKKIFIDIHKMPTSKAKNILKIDDVAEAMVGESRKLSEVYLKSQIGDKNLKRLTQDRKKMLAEIVNISEKKMNKLRISDLKTWVNTEVNNTNFLISEKREGGLKGSLVDWEKPIISDPAQDIGHFLAPTTTFWKTDIILDSSVINDFIYDYAKRLKDAYGQGGCGYEADEHLKKYRGFSEDFLATRCLFMTAFTCLRGLSWCAYAYIKYNSDDYTGLINKSTSEKLDSYLEPEYMEMIRDRLRDL